jgi:hypothetical protein
MWNSMSPPAGDTGRELETARRIARTVTDENMAAHAVLNDHGLDPDAEPGEPLHERLLRVLGARPVAAEQ